MAHWVISDVGITGNSSKWTERITSENTEL